MGLLDTSAMRRAEKRLAAWFEPGGRVLEFDIGTTRNGQKVHCVASTKAFYLVAPAGVGKIRYTEMVGTRGGPSWIAVDDRTGGTLTVDFGRGPRGLYDVVADQFNAVARQRSQFHVSWGGGGATFEVVQGDKGPEVTWRYDAGTASNMTTMMLESQALGELEFSLGIEPKGQYHNPRPGWMAEFEWNPPLLRATPHASPSKEDEDDFDDFEDDFEDGPDEQQ